MILELERLKNQKLRIHRAIPISSTRQPVVGCFYAASVMVDLMLQGEEDEFSLSGTVKAPMICTSHRSLETFEKTIDGEIDILFVPRRELSEDIEIELVDDDTNIQSYEGQLNIIDVIDEFVGLALPMRIISQEEEAEDKLAFSTDPDAVDGKQMDQRLIGLKAIKEQMEKRGDK